MKVRYWWSEDGEFEICERTEHVIEENTECYHCAVKLLKGDTVSVLKVLDDKDKYILCTQCADKNTQI